MSIQTYLDLITSEHQKKPKFEAMISADVTIPIRVQDLLTSMIPIFDPDLAVGSQLDTIGLWVGVSRTINVPIGGVYFSWNTSDATGWNYGIWKGTADPSSISTLPDDVYRNLIKSKIASNKWNGSIEGAYDVWETVFPNLTLLIQDNQNMTMAIGIVGGIIDSLTLALLTGGYIQIKPEGVEVSAYFVPVNTGPAFAWNVESDYLQGWGTGSWMTELEPT